MILSIFYRNETEIMIDVVVVFYIWGSETSNFSETN